MELNIEVTGDRELIARLNAMPSKVRAALVKEVTTLRLLLEAKVKGKLSGDVLNVRTGALRRSIFGETDDQATAVIGKVASSGDVKYGKIHEFGGVIHIPDIYPDKAKALHFMMGAQEVFAKHVKAHDVVMPERSFMRSSLSDMKPEIIEGLNEAVKEGLRE